MKSRIRHCAHPVSRTLQIGVWRVNAGLYSKQKKLQDDHWILPRSWCVCAAVPGESVVEYRLSHSLLLFLQHHYVQRNSAGIFRVLVVFD